MVRVWILEKIEGLSIRYRSTKTSILMLTVDDKEAT